MEVKGAEAATLEELRKQVERHLEELGFCRTAEGRWVFDGGDKAAFRQLHAPVVGLLRSQAADWIAKRWRRYRKYFADGCLLRPERIRPRLIPVEGPLQAELFRLAQLIWWSLPLSKGYGRRLRFLVWDEHHEKLIGILGLQSPPLSFPARDRVFRYSPQRKVELINQTMDIYTLGALPPYNMLLGGKLVALAAAANEVRALYREKYRHRPTLMEKRILPAHLVALTTTSAFGRSSLYARLHYRGEKIAESLGMTEGYGSFHLEGLYGKLRAFLRQQGVSVRGGFGTGPRIKWQNLVRALGRLGFGAELLRHGIPREAFLFRLCTNLEAYLAGSDPEPSYRDLPFEQLSEWWRERWLLPRAERTSAWYNFSWEESTFV